MPATEQRRMNPARQAARGTRAPGAPQVGAGDDLVKPAAVTFHGEEGERMPVRTVGVAYWNGRAGFFRRSGERPDGPCTVTLS